MTDLVEVEAVDPLSASSATLAKFRLDWHRLSGRRLVASESPGTNATLLIPYQQLG